MSQNVALNFSSTDYTDKQPSFSVGTDAEYNRGLKFANY